MGVEAVNNRKHLCKLGSLLRQISSTAAAKNHNIDFIFIIFYIAYVLNLNIFCINLKGFGCTACKHSHKLHILILADSTLDTSAQIAVAVNTNSDTHKISILSG